MLIARKIFPSQAQVIIPLKEHGVETCESPAVNEK